MSSTDALLQRLFRLHRFGIRPGLERIEALLQALGNPHRRYPAVHVTGTNGKGSLCALLASALQAQGYRVGLYTSPHLCHFTERIRIAGTPIDEAALGAYLPFLLQMADRVGATFFEVTTALAFALFAEYGVEIAVVEVGMGGRYDATNVVSPLVAAITGIDYDHQQYLGASLQEIAWQKVGIVKAGCAAVIGERRPWLRELLCQWATQCGASAVVIPSTEPTLIAALPNLSQHLRLPSGAELTLPLAGAHQRWNVALALTVAELLAPHFPLSLRSLTEGFCAVRSWGGLRARIEPLRLDPPVILDVAHNPGGITALIDTLDEHGYSSTRWRLVFGAMADKDIPAMLTVLQPRVSTLMACAPATERAAPTGHLLQYAQHLGITQSTEFPTVAEAVRAAWNCAEPTLITGSFYVAGEALQTLQDACATA